MKKIVLVDTTFIFRKVMGTDIYCKKSGKNYCREKIYEIFLNSIEKMKKRLGITDSEIIVCRDVRTDTLWRTKIFPGYKGKRTMSKYGPHIKDLYGDIFERYKTIRVDTAEADDIIGVLTYDFLINRSDKDIYILSEDKDFYQLITENLFPERLNILNPNKNKFSNVSFENIGSDFLENKIISGDKSDNIPKLKKYVKKVIPSKDYLFNKQLIDLTYTPMHIHDEVMRQFYGNRYPKIRLGYACINTELREKQVYCSRRISIKKIKEMESENPGSGLKELKRRSKNNVLDLLELVHWNHQNGIRFMRISSELLPHAANPRLTELFGEYDYSYVAPLLKKIGRVARIYKQRLTFHPGQYDVIGSPREEVFQNTLKDLEYHSNILDLLGMDQDSVMIVHIGGVYDDKEKTIERFIENFKRLPEKVQKRLVFENCETCYNIEDLLYISDMTQVPVVFDTHHHNCYQSYKGGLLGGGNYIPHILETWNRRNIKPKFHVSEQKCPCSGVKARLGAHSDYVEEIPEYLMEIPQKYGVDVDIMIEAKAKEKAVFHLYKKYPFLDIRSFL